MLPLSRFNPLGVCTPGGAGLPLPSSGSLIPIKSVKVISGVSAIIVGDPGFSPDIFRRLVFKAHALEFNYGGGTYYLTCGMMKSGVAIGGNYNVTGVSATSGTATGFSSNASVPNSVAVTASTVLASAQVRLLAFSLTLERQHFFGESVTGIIPGLPLRHFFCATPPAEVIYAEGDHMGIILGIQGGSQMSFRSGQIDVYGELA